MHELRCILIENARRFEHMQPRDAVKLVYQSTFGPGHMIKEPEQARKRLRCEMQALSPDSQPLSEPIGGGFVRVNLRAAKREGLSPETLGALFVQSAQEAQAAQKKELPLLLLRQLAAEGVLPFGAGELEDFLAQYCASGCPALSHSEDYRAAYAPAYRVVCAKYARLLPLLCALDRALAWGPVSLAIEGRCASGKTTLADFLLRVYPGARVVHMDDFFLPPHMRTGQRLAQAGGNVHYERFLEEAGRGVRTGEAFSHRVFDCSQGGFSGERHLPAAALTLVEGSYSMRPELEPLYTVSVFLDISPQEQQRRIARRNGPEGLAIFNGRWIPLEERYFQEMDVARRCLFRL